MSITTPNPVQENSSTVEQEPKQNPFPWIPIYRQIAEKLLEYRDKQEELKSIVAKSIKGLWKPLDFEIFKLNPFQIFAIFNQGTQDARCEIIKRLQNQMNVSRASLENLQGLPGTDSRGKTSAFIRKLDVNGNEIFWELTKIIVEDDFNISNESFRNLAVKCLEIKGIKLIYLSKLLYCIRPDKFLAINKKIDTYLIKKQIKEYISLREYISSKNIQKSEGKEQYIIDIYLKDIERIRDHFQNKFQPEILFPNIFSMAIEHDSQNSSTSNSESEKKQSIPIESEIKAFNEIKKLLEYKKQIILYGPPGTGKTYTANWAAEKLIENKKINRDPRMELQENVYLISRCTFHPEYGYEHFIEGYKPQPKHNQLIFKLEDGIFKKICKTAEEYPEVNFYLIIDEINRGDIPRIFGELITLIEDDKRNKKYVVKLPYSNQDFYVPENVYIIGTMNTADRSIALLDIALRRRFAFIEMPPDHVLVPEKYRDWFKKLNETIVNELGKVRSDAKHLQIGHSFFMKDKKDGDLNDEDVERIVKYEIRPLLNEYFCDEKDLPKSLLEALKLSSKEPKNITDSNNTEKQDEENNA
jgi:DNA polymerase III delta prime subunit